MNVNVKYMLLSICITTVMANNQVVINYSVKPGKYPCSKCEVATLKTYSNEIYKFTLKCPSEWKANPSYINRFDGKDGFFQFAAISAQVSIDKVAEEDAQHVSKPYGSNPKISKVKVQGQEGRLIMPSEDQAKEMNSQAGFIVQYPKPIKVGERVYNYFVLYSDKNHINDIIKTIVFSENR